MACCRVLESERGSAYEVCHSSLVRRESKGRGGRAFRASKFNTFTRQLHITLGPPGSGPVPGENGVLKALPMTTSRGPAAPHTLPAASGRERHVRDSPVVLGCARNLAAARHLQAWHLACSASGDLPQPGPLALPRLGAQYLSHIHLPSCGALIFIPSGLRPWARSWFSTCSKRPDCT